MLLFKIKYEWEQYSDKHESNEQGKKPEPLFPRLETKMYIIWKKYQVFTPIAELLLDELKDRFHERE